MEVPAPSPEGIVKRLDNLDDGTIGFVGNGQTSLGLLQDFDFVSSLLFGAPGMADAKPILVFE